MRYNKSLVAITALLASALPFQAKAKANVDVIIDLPSIAILNYVSEVTVTIPVDVFGNFIGGDTAGQARAFNEGQQSKNATFDGSGLQADFDISVTQPSSINFSAVNLLLKNVWAVRAIHDNNIAVVADRGTGTSLENGSSKIEVTAVTNPGAAFSAPGLLAPKYGDVQLTLDLSDATTNGEHSATDPTYLLAVNLL